MCPTYDINSDVDNPDVATNRGDVTNPEAQMMRGGMRVAASRVRAWRVDESDAPRVEPVAWYLECAHHGLIQNDGAKDAKLQYGE